MKYNDFEKEKEKIKKGEVEIDFATALLLKRYEQLEL